MGKQSEAFLKGEGDAWYNRNWLKRDGHDPVLDVIGRLSLRVGNVLEYGACDGSRLAELRKFKSYNCSYAQGVDPSAEAVRNGKLAHRQIKLIVGTADKKLRYKHPCFKTIIYGFCLYVSDPDDHFRIVMEGDRLLLAGGWIVIHDFHPDAPTLRKYKHLEGVNSFKMDYAQLWLAHPHYRLVHREVYPDGTGVTVIEKLPSVGWVEEEDV